MASLYLSVTGGQLGEVAIFASVSGYEQTPEGAVVVGACNWACAFGPVVTAGAVPPETGRVPDAEQFEVVPDGRRYRCVAAAIDRTMMFVEGEDPSTRIAAARDRFGAAVVDPDRARVEHATGADRPGATLLSVFVMDNAQTRTVEIKVNGCEWMGSAGVFAGADPEPAGGVALLRDLAVLVPTEPDRPGRSYSPISETRAARQIRSTGIEKIAR